MAMLKKGELAKRTGVTAETIRYYEKQGLLTAERAKNGYRLFDVHSVERLKFIQRAQSIGFNLKEIAELLALEIARDQHTCEEVKAITAAKQTEIKQKIQALQRMYDALALMNNRCCGGNHSAEHCTILTALADTDSQEEADNEHAHSH
ncbi:Zn(2+)-responsive transcriptional regulator [Vibrio quintilis]|uniref:HTH-type transcriptional regulator ZntR n=1 Tax=Vibrio quintilis TaxID=1117707 RepID=A0A1M7YY43_9VIBR|nr:Zn(2+)-responsive transcriptional regulator [Vibrio quintilis]SHO57396.1 HTH-type transcriptional regulator ZntR [Vibrio quintilis]